jgi:replicative superfamily II helicase
MSATLANIDDLVKFLDAQFYEERFRPVFKK